MKNPTRLSRSAFTALSLALLPFVVAFDYPDTTGVRAKVSAGRGTYSLSTCSRSFQSDYVEENVGLRATFATGSEGTTWGERLRPGKTTVGAYGDWVQEELVLIREDGGRPDRPVTPKKDNGSSFGAYAQFDWRLFGLEMGALNLGSWDADEEYHDNRFVPTAEVRLGPEYFFASTAFFSGAPVLSGGGGVAGGVGGRLGGTRIWGGLSTFPARENCLSFKVSQKLGPAYLGMAGQWAFKASGYDGNHEHGISLGLDIPLSKAW
jgi:hypothetical protein